jgi:hypothetical protein
MLQLLKRTSTALCDRISRRDWLRVGGLGQVIRGIIA